MHYNERRIIGNACGDAKPQAFFFFYRIRACLEIHSRHLHPLICGIFLPNSINVARYASFIWQKSPTNCRIHLSESNFQTRSRVPKAPLVLCSSHPFDTLISIRNTL
ncbi:DUF6783 domain-containing protein [Lachnospiraceae bacterium JLR.KK009]